MRFTSKGRSFGEGERYMAIASGCPSGWVKVGTDTAFCYRNRRSKTHPSLRVIVRDEQGKGLLAIH